MPQSPFTVSLELALTGKGAPHPAIYRKSLSATASTLEWLRRQRNDKTLELLEIPWRKNDLRMAAKQAVALKAMSTVVVLGIGGSSLGGQALGGLRKSVIPFVEFHDNPDPFSWAVALKRFDLRKTHFVCISKSGGTAETLMQVLTAVEALENLGVKSLKKHFTIITEPHRSALADFAESISAVKLDHPTGVGGRYSILTAVGALPGLLMGLNFKAVRDGAQVALDQVMNARTPADAPAACGAALHCALAHDNKLATTVLWPYVDSLAVFGDWWRQLWAESLGKDGQGSTPVSVLGPVDQHSQLQLFRDGPGKALFTLISVDTQGKGPKVPKTRARMLGLDYLAGKTLGDLVDAEVRATAQTLFKNDRPVRHIHLAKMDEFHMGALMMHFMLETIIMGRLMGVNPFDQPGVEEGKLLARQYLAERA